MGIRIVQKLLLQVTSIFMKNNFLAPCPDHMAKYVRALVVVQSLSRVWLWPRGLQHSRPPCPSPTPGVYSNSCPLSQWCHPTVSSSVVPLSSCLQSFPASVIPKMSALRIRWPKCWSFSFSISPANEYSGLISFRLIGLISLQSKGLSRVFFSTAVQKH